LIVDIYAFSKAEISAEIGLGTDRLALQLFIALQFIRLQPDELEELIRKESLHGETVASLRQLHLLLESAGALACMAADRIEAACTADRTGQVH
jgi:hypothetical protein